MSRTKVRIWLYSVVVSGLVVYLTYATWMPGSSYAGELPTQTPQERATRDRLRGHVEALANEIGARNVDHPDQLLEARNYLWGVLTAPSSGGSGKVWLEAIDEGRGAENIVFEVSGTSGTEVVVVGAHYDSCDDSPGANDNGSGVAVALELARAIARRPAANVIRVVLFANEEPPFFQLPGMGSRSHSLNARRRGDPIRAMLSLETMGFYSEDVGSQRYPWPVGLLYPSTGNFIAFVGDLGSRALVHEAIGSFRVATPFPSEGAALPATFPGVDWSDHWSFRREGYPAILVTDTALYRDPHYHRPTDTSDRLNYDALARVTTGLEAVVRHLAR